jgi:hypothetical protein
MLEPQPDKSEYKAESVLRLHPSRAPTESIDLKWKSSSRPFFTRFPFHSLPLTAGQASKRRKAPPLLVVPAASPTHAAGAVAGVRRGCVGTKEKDNSLQKHDVCAHGERPPPFTPASITASTASTVCVEKRDTSTFGTLMHTHKCNGTDGYIDISIHRNIHVIYLWIQ